ncbi:MAG: diguanylate cyclase [Deltaproteobacteria bacterium]|nr:diguanylate cyclase [Deltaproteobacteria bacterium]
MKARTLLVVDDSPTIRALVKDAVTAGGLFSNILEADDGIEALKIFFKNKIDFVVTDVMMPKVDGYKFIAAIKESAGGKDIPVIILSGSRKEVIDKIKGLNIGASDYLIKPFDSSELVARINVFLKIQELQNELKEKNMLLEKLSVTDELTGLYNRRYFYDYISMHVALAKRHDYHIGCLLIDIDRFKSINDTYGHDVGDKVLKGIAEIMAKKMREGEVLARFGGEEFIICLCRADNDGAIRAAERMRMAVEDANLSDDNTPPLKITISVGIAIYPQQGLENSDDIIKAADEALYHAKRTGRNKVMVYSESMVSSKDQKEVLYGEKNL